MKAILVSFAQAAASTSQSKAEAGQTESAEHGNLDESNVRQQVRRAMRELVPLFHECQEMGHTKKLPSGKLIFEMSVVGDESLGGLVEDVRFTDDSELKSNSQFAECIRETLFSLKLSTPKGRGRLLIRYPMAFGAGPTPPPETQIPKAEHSFEKQ